MVSGENILYILCFSSPLLYTIMCCIINAMNMCECVVGAKICEMYPLRRRAASYFELYSNDQ